MKRWRDLLLIIGLFGVLIAFTVYGPGSNQPETQGEPGSANSAGEDGALGLQRWLQALGYNTINFQYTDWRIPNDAAALFILAPTEVPITTEQADEVLRWVRNGGTLVLVQRTPSQGFNRNPLLEKLQANAIIQDNTEPVAQARAAQPLLSDPPVVSVPVNSKLVLEIERADYVPLLSTKLGPTLVGLQEGSGYVYLASALYPFTNTGIREPGSAPLILNLLARIPRGATILFDEYHHGYNTPPTIRRVALRQGWGWAVVYSVLVVGLYIVLTGRRFGRAVPLRSDVARRSSAEYVQSLALLLRRARKQDFITAHYHQQLKRRLAKPYGFVPPQDDEAFVAELERYRGVSEEQAAQLRAVLSQLRRPAGDEQLVQAVRAADALAAAKGRIG